MSLKLKNLGVWFDIPVVDLQRANDFYRAVLQIDVVEQAFGDIRFSVLAHDEGNGGCLVPGADKVSAKGILVYLNVEGRIRDAVQKVLSVGGKVLEDVHAIGEHGHRALVLDSEGNRIALHSNVDA